VRIVSYIKDSKITYEETDLCNDAFLQLQIEKDTDRLSDNYSFSNLNLDRMVMFNFVFDNNKPVLCSGCENIYPGVVRVMSRYYHYKDFRTDGTSMFEKVDDFKELTYCVDNLNVPLIIWTREFSKGFFTKLKRARPDIFKEWNVYPDKLQIGSPPLKKANNLQYVFYKGDINYLRNPQCESAQT